MIRLHDPPPVIFETAVAPTLSRHASAKMSAPVCSGGAGECATLFAISMTGCGSAKHMEASKPWLPAMAMSVRRLMGFRHPLTLVAPPAAPSVMRMSSSPFPARRLISAMTADSLDMVMRVAVLVYMAVLAYM